MLFSDSPLTFLKLSAAKFSVGKELRRDQGSRVGPEKEREHFPRGFVWFQTSVNVSKPPSLEVSWGFFFFLFFFQQTPEGKQIFLLFCF